MKGNILIDKTAAFAVRIVNFCNYLNNVKSEFTLSNQILRSGTSIGANAAESIYAQSRSDFINKLSIARKEASETAYWLTLLFKTDYIDLRAYNSMKNDCEEILKLLTSSIMTAYRNRRR